MKQLKKKKPQNELADVETSTRRRGKRVAPIIALAFLALVIGVGAFLYYQHRQTQTKTYSGKGPDSGSYQVVSETKNGDTTRISVVISDLTDDELIQLNDKIYEEKKSAGKNVYIDYFTDKDVAEIYFKQISEPGTTNEQKKELVKHYRAVMISSPIMGKKLQLVQAQNNVLKSY